MSEIAQEVPWPGPGPWLDEVDLRLEVFREFISAKMHHGAHLAANYRARRAEHDGTNSYIAAATIGERGRRDRHTVGFGDEVLVALGCQIQTGNIGRAAVYRLRFYDDLGDHHGRSRMDVDFEALADIHERSRTKPPKKDENGNLVRKSIDVSDPIPIGLKSSLIGLSDPTTTTRGEDAFADAQRPTDQDVYEFIDELGRRLELKLDPVHSGLERQARRLLFGGWTADRIPLRYFDDLPKTKRPSGIIARRLGLVRTSYAERTLTADELADELDREIRRLLSTRREQVLAVLAGWDHKGEPVREFLSTFSLGDLRSFSETLAPCREGAAPPLTTTSITDEELAARAAKNRAELAELRKVSR